MNKHDFDFKIPMYPRADDTSLKMDGAELHGVTSLTIKAGSNGYTNVAIELEAPAAVRFAGHLMASLHDIDNEEVTLRLSAIYREVEAKIIADLDGDGSTLDTETHAQADFVMLLISRCIEEIGSQK